MIKYCQMLILHDISHLYQDRLIVGNKFSLMLPNYFFLYLVKIYFVLEILRCEPYRFTNI